LWRKLTAKPVILSREALSKPFCYTKVTSKPVILSEETLARAFLWEKTKIKTCHPEPCQPLANAIVADVLWQGVRIPSLGTSGVPRGLPKTVFS